MDAYALANKAKLAYFNYRKISEKKGRFAEGPQVILNEERKYKELYFAAAQKFLLIQAKDYFHYSYNDAAKCFKTGSYYAHVLWIQIFRRNWPGIAELLETIPMPMDNNLKNDLAFLYYSFDSQNQEKTIERAKAQPYKLLYLLKKFENDIEAPKLEKIRKKIIPQAIQKGYESDDDTSIFNIAFQYSLYITLEEPAEIEYINTMDKAQLLQSELELSESCAHLQAITKEITHKFLKQVGDPLLSRG